MEVRLAVGTKQEGEMCMIPRNLSVVDVLMSLLHRLVTECSDVLCTGPVCCVSRAQVGYLHVSVSLVHR